MDNSSRMSRPMRGVPVRRTAESRESGFTLVEMMFAMLLFGIIVAIGVAPYRNYRLAQAHVGTTRSIVAALRNAQITAVAENATYRVRFGPNGKTWRLERVNGSTFTQVGPTYRVSDDGLKMRDLSFRQSDGTVDRHAYFYPRGSASKGSLVVERGGRDKVYTITVEGLTARVSYS